jgi:hypothetical protein
MSSPGTKAAVTNVLIRRGPFLVAALAILAWRLVQIRHLALPVWVDSVHHTLLVRILLEQRRIPETWGPYLPEVPLYYHFGFHLTAACFALLTGWTGTQLGRAVLVVGQLWQVGLACGVYAVARRLWGSEDKALTAMVLVGFVSQMPAFYLSWGRYSLLAGLTLLTFTMAAALSGRGVLVALGVAATALTHYYAFALLGLFLGFVLLTTADRSRRLTVGAGAAVGALAATPWLLRVWRWTQAYARAPHGDGGGASGASDPTSPLALLGPARNHMVLALAVLGFLLLAVHLRHERPARRAAGLALLAWAAALTALLGPWHVGPFRPDHAAIVLFLPAVLLAAHALWELLPTTGATAATLALVLWGIVQTRDVVRPDTVLARPEELLALDWVQAHTPEDAAFLIDVRPWMGLWRGADAGFWIMPLTGRRTLLPPAAYGWGQPELASIVRANAARADEVSRLPQSVYCSALERLMQETGTSYYYTRSPRPAACPELAVVYQGAAGVRVLTLRGDVPSEARAAGL